MKILILKGDSPRHNYFAKEISEINGIESLIISPTRLSNKRMKRMLLKSPMTFINRVSKYIFQKLRRWNQKEKVFFGDIVIIEEQKVERLNSKRSIYKMKKFEPDLLVAFGIPIISNKVIEIPRFGAINLHGGISPNYKGGNTIFWPLYKNDIALTGATLHYMVKKVDSGRVISRVYPDINSNDNEFTVSAKTFKYAVREMIDIVEWVKKNKSPIPGIDQVDNGHIYLAKYRSFFIDLIGGLVIRKNLKKISLNKRVERYYE